MKFDELIQLKARQLKAAHSGAASSIIDHAIVSGAVPSGLMRNLCASISNELFSRVENTCGYLDISKRAFVEAALIEALDRADAILDQVNPIEESR